MLTSPGNSLHALLVIGFQQNMVVTHCVRHQIGFIYHRPIGEILGNRVRRIDDMDADILIMRVFGQTAITDADNLMPK